MKHYYESKMHYQTTSFTAVLFKACAISASPKSLVSRHICERWFKVMKVSVVCLVISTKCFTTMKVQEIESWNFACPNILKRCAWRPNFSHFSWEMTKISTVPVQHRCPTFSIGHSIQMLYYYHLWSSCRTSCNNLIILCCSWRNSRNNLLLFRTSLSKCCD